MSRECGSTACMWQARHSVIDNNKHTHIEGEAGERYAFNALPKTVASQFELGD